MRILFHHRIRSKDGQYVHLSELVQAFRNCGHEVLLVGPRVIEEEGLGNGSGSIGWLRRWLPGWVPELLECLYALVAWPRLHRAIRRFRPDLIYERYNLFFPTGVWAARAAGVPLASEINAPLFEERSKEQAISLAELARRSQRYVWQRADLLLPVSQALAEIVESAGGPSDRIRVLHNGVDTTRFQPSDTEAAKRAIGLGGRLVLGFVGFVREWHASMRSSVCFPPTVCRPMRIC